MELMWRFRLILFLQTVSIFHFVQINLWPVLFVIIIFVCKDLKSFVFFHHRLEHLPRKWHLEDIVLSPPFSAKHPPKCLIFCGKIKSVPSWYSTKVKTCMLYYAATYFLVIFIHSFMPIIIIQNTTFYMRTIKW